MPLVPWGLGGRTGLGEGGFPNPVGSLTLQMEGPTTQGAQGPQHPERGMMACRKHFSLCPSHVLALPVVPQPFPHRSPAVALC